MLEVLDGHAGVPLPVDELGLRAEGDPNPLDGLAAGLGGCTRSTGELAEGPAELGLQIFCFENTEEFSVELQKFREASKCWNSRTPNTLSTGHTASYRRTYRNLYTLHSDLHLYTLPLQTHLLNH